MSEVILPDTSKLVVSNSPHVHSKCSVNRIMLDVIIALLPAAITGVLFFGFSALFVMIMTTLFCIILEVACLKLLNKPLTIAADGSAAVTGLLLGMNLAAGTPWWICLIGSFLAIPLAKHLYGGLGYNPFNPALVGRVGLLIAFPTELTRWPTNNFSSSNVDALVSATPLSMLNSGELSIRELFFGTVGGCIGEVSAFAILIGGVYLICRKLIKWQVPLFFILTVFAITGVMHLINPNTYASPMLHIFSGGLMLGAFFMATDMVTSPITTFGCIIFAVGCGIITAVIRLWGSYPEGVSFAILFMNAFVPMIDRFTRNTTFGAKLEEK
ncbi:MAG: RnfABCDGE type electron transport complex subunit D [Lentisphaeria bacterium]